MSNLKYCLLEWSKMCTLPNKVYLVSKSTIFMAIDVHWKIKMYVLCSLSFGFETDWAITCSLVCSFIFFGFVFMFSLVFFVCKYALPYTVWNIPAKGIYFALNECHFQISYVLTEHTSPELAHFCTTKAARVYGVHHCSIFFFLQHMLGPQAIWKYVKCFEQHNLQCSKVGLF